MTMIMRIWVIAAGLVMVIITSTIFSTEKQGYYYTFNSLIGLQAFFELGLNYVLIQIVSHDAVNLRDDVDPLVRQAAIERIATLYLGIRRWFAVPAILFAILIGVGGLFFLDRGSGVARWEWIGAWLLMVIPVSLNLYFSPQLAITEGLGKVGEVARLRLFQSMAGYLLCWSVLAVSPTLWAPSCIPAAVTVSYVWWLHRRSGLRAIATGISSTAHSYSWRREILPLQWRIGLSWIGGYLLTQAFTPMVFAHQGAAEAAKIGLSLAMFNNIALVSMSWLSATNPKLAGMLARNERTMLKREFRHLVMQSLAFQVIACLGLCVVIVIGRRLELTIMYRFLPTIDLVLLGMASTANVAIFSLATYMRIHKEEPMLWNSLVCGLLACGGAFVASFYSTDLVIIVYLSVILLISLPWATLLFTRYWRRSPPHSVP